MYTVNKLILVVETLTALSNGDRESAKILQIFRGANWLGLVEVLQIVKLANLSVTWPYTGSCFFFLENAVVSINLTSFSIIIIHFQIGSDNVDNLAVVSGRRGPA